MLNTFIQNRWLGQDWCGARWGGWVDGTVKIVGGGVRLRQSGFVAGSGLGGWLSATHSGSEPELQRSKFKIGETSFFGLGRVFFHRNEKFQKNKSHLFHIWHLQFNIGS